MDMATPRGRQGLSSRAAYGGQTGYGNAAPALAKIVGVVAVSAVTERDARGRIAPSKLAPRAVMAEC